MKNNITLLRLPGIYRRDRTTEQYQKITQYSDHKNLRQGVSHKKTAPDNSQVQFCYTTELSESISYARPQDRGVFFIHHRAVFGFAW